MSDRSGFGWSSPRSERNMKKLEVILFCITYFGIMERVLDFTEPGLGTEFIGAWALLINVVAGFADEMVVALIGFRSFW